MKKLMTVIAAVAMSFGLFADATPFSISFETEEGSAKGVDTSLMKFTPGEGWTWSGDALDMLKYDGDAYEYVTTERRDSEFDDAANLNYLKLETGDKELVRAMGTDNVFVDQLVKFTGFEDPQTNLVAGTKIAVWMSGTENDDTATPAVVGETNLYVTCAKVDADNNVEQIALKIANPADGAVWETEKWYRLTIKSIKNIFETTGSRAGFIVYIDGVQVGSSDDAAKTLIVNDNELTSLAAGYMAKGQLFPAIDATDTTFNTVAYKGIGWIDDVILDDQGPDFCKFVNVTVTPIVGAVIKVEQDGKEITIGDDGKYAVAPGTFTVTYTADEGYILTPVVKTHDTAELDDEKKVDDSAEVEPQVVVVEVTYGGDEMVEYADEMTAFAAIAEYTQTPGATADADFKQGATNELAGYAFDQGVYIEISDDYDETEPEKALSSFWGISSGNVTFTKGLENNKKVTFTGAVEETPTYTLTFGGVMKAGSSITADALDAAEGAITLDPTDCFVATVAGKEACFAAVDGYELETEVDEESGLTKYFLIPAEPEIEYVTFTVEYDGTKVENVTVKTNGADVVADELGAYTVESNAVVTVAADAKDGYKSVTINREGEIKDGVFTADTDGDEITISAEVIVYTITYMNGDKEITGLDPATYTVEAAANLPETVELLGASFKGWYNDVGCTGDAVTVIPVGSTGSKTFYAKVEAVIDPAQQVIDDKVDGTPEEKAAAKENTQKLVNLLGDKDKTEAWIEKVYGTGAKITAATLAAAPANSVEIAVAFDVPVMVEPTISAPVVAEKTTGPAAFEFAIKDGSTEVEIKTLTDNVKKIVKYAAALGGTNTFGPAGDKVTIGLNEGKIKAEFVAGPAAGFMKADFTAAE